MANTAGYSKTPLAKKLGIKSGFKIKLIGTPQHYRALFTDWPNDVSIIAANSPKKDLIHYFTVSRAELERDIKPLREQLEENGCLWISWPKRTSGVATDLTEDVIRQVALQNKLVDVKVCAIDETWSGLKLMIRIKDRK